MRGRDHDLIIQAAADELYAKRELVKEQVPQSARDLRGHLTATVHGAENDLHDYAELIQILKNKVGRIIFNGYPTGVEVCHAMVHGGPYPASTDSRTTSVGTQAIFRFARPVCYQDFPNPRCPTSCKTITLSGSGEWSTANSPVRSCKWKVSVRCTNGAGNATCLRHAEGRPIRAGVGHGRLEDPNVEHHARRVMKPRTCRRTMRRWPLRTRSYNKKFRGVAQW